MGVRSITANEGTVRAGDRLTLSIDVTPKRVSTERERERERESACVVDVMGVRSITANEGTVRAGDRLTLSIDVTPKRVSHRVIQARGSLLLWDGRGGRGHHNLEACM
jgi:MOSC domain-containing protein YiiM